MSSAVDPERRSTNGVRVPATTHAGAPNSTRFGRQPAQISRRAAARATWRCILQTAALLTRGRLHRRSDHLGIRLHFADGTSARIFRETVADRESPRHPCVLVVEFRLKFVRGWGHTLFRWESLLNTPLFAGYAGFVSKLWVAHDERGRYRGIYEWDGPEAAEYYAGCLARVLELCCEPHSIRCEVLPGVRRDDLLALF